MLSLSQIKNQQFIKAIKQGNARMKVLSIEESQNVSGGFLQLIAAFVAVFVLPKVINDNRKEYNQWGHNLGEAAWEWQHPYDPNNPSNPYH